LNQKAVGQTTVQSHSYKLIRPKLTLAYTSCPPPIEFFRNLPNNYDFIFLKLQLASHFYFKHLGAMGHIKIVFESPDLGVSELYFG